MTEEEDFMVAEPYRPTEDEKQAIAKLEAKGLKAKNWDSKRKFIKSFKENLREDMYEKQNELCAKDEHPQWMFLPENLCIACPLCNEFKGTTEVLANPNTKTYPRNGSGFKIIHPLYDRYSEHVDLIGGILYRGKTDKGRFTIATCHLYRVKLAEERVTQLKIEENEGTIIAGLMKLLSQSEMYVDDNKKFIQRVTKIVDSYKQKLVENEK